PGGGEVWDGLSHANKNKGYYRKVLGGEDIPILDRHGGIGFHRSIEHWPFTFDYDLPSLVDGLKLLRQVGNGGSACDMAPPPAVHTVNDLPRAEQFLNCVADRI